MRYEVNGRKILRVGREFLHIPIKLYNELAKLLKEINRFWYDTEYFQENFPTIFSFFKRELTTEET